MNKTNPLVTSIIVKKGHKETYGSVYVDHRVILILNINLSPLSAGTSKQSFVLRSISKKQGTIQQAR